MAHLDKRKVIRQSLRTRDHLVAGLKARAIDEGLEKYWRALLKGRSSQSAWQLYASAVDLASSLGFTYRSMEELVASGNERDLVDRMMVVRDQIHNKAAVDALLGNAPTPSLTLGTLYSSYEENNRLALSAMSPKQLRHHEGQRRRAIEYAKTVVGDKALEDITRADVLRFRQWWIDKTQSESLTVEAANKCFSNIKGMLTVVDDALHTDYGSLWGRLLLRPTPGTKAKQRPPYPANFIQNEILKPGALDGLNHEARMIVYLMVETGLRPSEACNLRTEDIVLDTDIPYVSIAERADRVQKTDSSVRSVPLVGVSLWAAQQCPKGFPRYRDNADSFSAAVNKFLENNKLRPTPRHSIYSLRHSFQDRILAANALDRVQADLMGHAFDREKYGEGATLEAKREVLDRIKFAWS